MNSFCRQRALGIEGRHAAGTGGRNPLAVIVISDTSRGKHSVNAGVSPLRSGPLNILLLGQFELPAEKIGVRGMSDRREVPARRELFGAMRVDRALDPHAGDAGLVVL